MKTIVKIVKLLVAFVILLVVTKQSEVEVK